MWIEVWLVGELCGIYICGFNEDDFVFDVCCDVM